MCGVSGIISSRSLTYMKKILIESLEQLQNRGYDSAGVSILTADTVFRCSKHVKQPQQNIYEKIHLDLCPYTEGFSAVGHNRWATHGGVTSKNAHPHCSQNGEFYLVHNGIFENYSKWKEFLKEKKYTFYSETDTEVICNVIQYFHDQGLSICEILEKLYEEIHGTYALILQYRQEPNKLYATKKGSPLLVGKNKNSVLLTSEKSGFMDMVETYIVLNPKDVCIVERTKDGQVDFETKQSNYSMYAIVQSDFAKTPGTFPHWTKKEIFEQPESFFRAINYGGRLSKDLKIVLGGLIQHRERILTSETLILLGCGTSLHSCLYCKEFLRPLKLFQVIEVVDGSEFNKDYIPFPNKTVAILVSQSGETNDLYRCIPILKTHSVITVGVINVVDSLIAREVDCGVYCNAGREVGVASTKAFFSQVLILILFSLWVDQEKEKHENDRTEILLDFLQLSEQVEEVLKLDGKIRTIAEKFHNCKSLFLLGKGHDEIIAKEGSLKIKEITYIHGEAYNASALKHGPFALLDKNVPVILLCSKAEHEDKITNCHHEISAREAPVILITEVPQTTKENVIVIPKNKHFGSLLTVIPLQLMAYYMSVFRNLDPDKPRNLAKVVTVE